MLFKSYDGIVMGKNIKHLLVFFVQYIEVLLHFSMMSLSCLSINTNAVSIDFKKSLSVDCFDVRFNLNL